VNTGDPDAPYKLLLTSTNSGTDYAMTVDTSDLDDPGHPVIDQTVQAATDATLELGTGAGKISITKSTNTITDVIPGLTLNLKSADLEKTVILQVQVDRSAMQKSVEDFVTQYNNIVDFLNSQFDYDPQDSQIGVLFGDFRLQTIQADLASSVLNPVSGLTQSTKALSQVGITMDQMGKLSINTTELQSALQDKLAEAKNLFSVGFDSTSSVVSYVSNTSDTKASSATGYSVSVTQAAVKSRVTAGIAQGGTLSQKETLTINGSTIVLDAGWSQQQVLDQINEYTKYTGIAASATGAGGAGSGNYLTLTQVSYGSAFHITAQSAVSSGSGNNSGLGNVEVTEADADGESGLGAGAAGQDMVGTINGVSAKAQGQYLIGQPGSDGTNPANGLKLRIETTGAMTATVNFSKGVAGIMRDLLMQATDATGSVTVAEDSLNQEISDIRDQIADWETRLTTKENDLYTQFNAMEDALAKLQQQGQYLASMLGSSSLFSG
jgi:flagellar hook-associated protein 2